MKEKLMEILSEALEIDIEDLSLDTPLDELETWDSISVVSCLAEFDDQFGQIVDGQDLSDCKTPNEIMKLLSINE